MMTVPCCSPMAVYFITLSLLSMNSYVHSSLSSAAAMNRPSSVNCTWKYVEQPLSHFARGATQDKSYRQRLCVYSSYWAPNKGLPIFLYTGNESPVEAYVNNTGLMWNLAQSMHALVVFAEHRYFGGSIPEIDGVENCLSYLSSQEALADYASVVKWIRSSEWGGEGSAVIAFGGSYGGMLSSWMRIMYPHAIDGAISSSAPVWGFPLNNDCPTDSSARVVTHAASSSGGSSPLCVDNLKGAYVLIHDIGHTIVGRHMLSKEMNLCTPLVSTTDVAQLLQYLQSPLFDLSEGSYPFPSDYITFALTGSNDPLPAWAMKEHCRSLDHDYGLVFEGDVSDVLFTLKLKQDVEIYVDWDVTSNNNYTIEALHQAEGFDLLNAVASAIQIWYNVSGSIPTCIDWSPTSTSTSTAGDQRVMPLPLHSLSKHSMRSDTNIDHLSSPVSNVKAFGAKSTSICSLPDDQLDAGTAWNALVCNEGINLVNWWVQGVGQDLYYPPNQPTRNYSFERLVERSMDYCPYLEGLGLVGIPQKSDVWAQWIDTVYGGERMQYASNIVFTNGDLDPWSPAGVKLVDGKDRSLVSLTIDQGGHHLDLFWPTDDDPDSVRRVRDLERDYIMKWIDEVANRKRRFD